MKPMTVTALRNDIYNVFAKVGKTGVPLKVKSKGKQYKVVLDKAEKEDIFAKLTPHPDAINGDPEDLVDFKVYEWKPDENI